MPKLVNVDTLIAQTIELEALALKELTKYGLSEDPVRWSIWNAILADRKEFKYDLINAPTVDAVEVVRCKDCWVFHQDETWNPKAGLCGWFDRPVGVNDFCSNGERKEDAEIS